MLSRISSSINFYVNEYNDHRYAKQISAIHVASLY